MATTDSAAITIIGAGLAGSEAAWQLAERRIPVTLQEMKPENFSPAHSSEDLAELVCSNSLRSDSPDHAAGLLKRELIFQLRLQIIHGVRIPWLFLKRLKMECRRLVAQN